MDYDLQTKVCFEMGAAFGYIAAHNPKDYFELFSGTFTEEELDTIESLAQAYPSYKLGEELMNDLMDKLKEEDDDSTDIHVEW